MFCALLYKTSLGLSRPYRVCADGRRPCAALGLGSSAEVQQQFKEVAMTPRSVLDENKRFVSEFYELAINQQRPAEAARKYIELPYRQHNPEVVDGPDGFVQFISNMQKKHPKLKVTISKALADDDLVALHVHLTREADDPGLAIAELFRLKNGKIIEHWDVVQPIPEKTASGDSMFRGRVRRCDPSSARLNGERRIT